MRSAKGSWDFAGVNSSYLVHGIHPYPARMHPHIVKILIDRFGKKRMIIADPFCGSGTVLVESLASGHDCVGVDLNPLACLISKAKTTVIPKEDLLLTQKQIVDQLSRARRRSILPLEYRKYPYRFWFKRKALGQLLLLRDLLTESNLWSSRSRWLLVSALSRTARAVSNQRPSEFKSYRLSEQDLRRHNPDVFGTFRGIITDTIMRLGAYYETLPEKVRSGSIEASLVQADARDLGARKIVDMVITSPPYGDSDTTVGYEQFSRIPLLILGIRNRKLGWTRGSDPLEDTWTNFPGGSTATLFSRVSRIDRTRSRVLRRYFASLWRSLLNIDSMLRNDGVACIVVGPRTVSGIRIRTPDILLEFAQALSLKCLSRTKRRLVMKTQPRRNNLAQTINEEEILVFRKGG